MRATAARAVRGASTAAVLLVVTGCQLMAAPSATTASGIVVAVVDGDTIDVQTERWEQRVRIIGLDAPEIGRDGSPSDCYAEQSRAFLDELLYERTVTLEADPSQDDTDAYGRSLRHVLIDGSSAAQLAIAAGAAEEFTFAAPYARRATYMAAQDAAESAGLGIWGACR